MKFIFSNFFVVSAIDQPMQLSVISSHSTIDQYWIRAQYDGETEINCSFSTIGQESFVPDNFIPSINLVSDSGSFLEIPTSTFSAYQDCVIACGFGSEFGRSANRALFYRTSSDPDSMRILVGPINPHDYCIPNSLAIIRPVFPEGETQGYIRASISVVGQPDDEPDTHVNRFAVASTFPRDTIPRSVYNQLVSILGSNGLAVHDDVSILGDCTAAYESLPDLRYTIYTDESLLDYFEMFVKPDDYLHIRDGECELLVYPTDIDDAQMYLLGGEEVSTPFRITETVLRQVALYMDYENEILGFCDPL